MKVSQDTIPISADARVGRRASWRTWRTSRPLPAGQADWVIPPDRPEVAAFLAWWEANKQDWLIPWPEEPEAP